MNCIVSLYTHPDAYPPTLNAIFLLSQKYSRVYVLYRPVLNSKINFPENVIVKTVGRQLFIRDFEKKSNIYKLWTLLIYTLSMYKLIKKTNSTLLLIYDPIPLLSVRILSAFLPPKIKIWYHNHDIILKSHTKKYSIGWLASHFEHSTLIKYISIFSLPAEERQQMYPMHKISIPFFLIPNYPSLHFFGKYYKKRNIENEVRLIFQGAIGEGHGLENIAKIVYKKTNKYIIKLILKGIIRDEQFLNKLKTCMHDEEVYDDTLIQYRGFGSYKDLPLTTSNCNIGIGMHCLNNDLHNSLAKSSNKIYEYASVGLPVIVFNSPHFVKHLSRFKWVYFADDNISSIENAIEYIVNNYEEMSIQARKYFENELNYEKHFMPALNVILC